MLRVHLLISIYGGLCWSITRFIFLNCLHFKLVTKTIPIMFNRKTNKKKRKKFRKVWQQIKIEREVKLWQQSKAILKSLQQLYRSVIHFTCHLGWNLCGFVRANKWSFIGALTDNFHAWFTWDVVAMETAHQHYNFVNYPCKTSHLLSPYSRNTQSHIKTAQQKKSSFSACSKLHSYLCSKKYLRWCFFFSLHLLCFFFFIFSPSSSFVSPENIILKWLEG